MLNMRTAVMAGVSAASLLVLGTLTAPQAQAAEDLEAKAQAEWREAIIKVPAPEQACFHASYPSLEWTKVECSVAPNRPYMPRSTKAARSDTTGDGNDYAASATGIITASTGTFPSVTGALLERDGLSLNTYSLQLNSNFMHTAVCAGKAACLSWEQFVYSSSEKQAFMQYWLIDYGTCPTGAGWITTGSDCYKNSAAVSVPKLTISNLSTEKVAASALLNGTDTFVFTGGGEAYSTSGPDSVVDLATGWSESEFNIVGDGGGSQATFTPGTSITVNVAVTNGTTNAPGCASNAGTTGETNNLTLGACTAVGGSNPSITFSESN